MKVQLCLLFLAICAISARRIRRSYAQLTCDTDYGAMDDHSLCLTDPSTMDAATSVVTSADAIAITNKHNVLRRLPTATDMMMMRWDSRLADVAQKWANQCPHGHESSATKRGVIDIGITVGQNVAMGYTTWDAAIQAWYDEVSMFQYGYAPSSYLANPGAVMHYTQVVQRDSFLIGCGYAECSGTNYTRYYVCNYVGPNSDTATPYTNGTDCAKCPDHCTDGLCDCDGKICKNGGALNLATCQCDCPVNDWGEQLFQGETCDVLTCPNEDRVGVCNVQWFPSMCGSSNVPLGCPYMCGICQDSDRPCDGKTCINGGSINVADCTCTCVGLYEGDTCQTLNCPAQDKPGICGSQFYYGPEKCTQYTNVPIECPYMCGLCDDSQRPCGGKICQNGATIDADDTCNCLCPNPYVGELCETKDCPNADGFWCDTDDFTVQHCTMYSNGPNLCPNLCGLCP